MSGFTSPSDLWYVGPFTQNSRRVGESLWIDHFVARNRDTSIKRFHFTDVGSINSSPSRSDAVNINTAEARAQNWVDVLQHYSSRDKYTDKVSFYGYSEALFIPEVEDGDVFLLLDGPEDDFKLCGGIQPYPTSPDIARIHRRVDLNSGRNFDCSSIRFSFSVLMLSGLAFWTKYYLRCHSRWTASVSYFNRTHVARRLHMRHILV